MIQSWPGVVVVSGDALRAAVDCCRIAARSRRLSGLPHSRTHDDLLTAFLTAAGRVDVRETVAAPPLTPTVTIEEAADRMNKSRRQVRRMAPKLGGKKIGGRWLLDDQAITEHLEGAHGG